MSAIGSVTKSALKVTTAAVTAATVAVGKFATSSIEAGMTFDSSMSQVAATMGENAKKMIEYNGETVESIQALEDFAQQMGSTTAFSASEAADALNYMALAGYDAETSMKMLPNVLNLAAAGGIELATASDMVTDAQTALGLSLDETEIMVDQMAKASSKTNTSVQQLGEAFLTVGGNAKNLAGGTTELSQVLGVMADNGIKGSEAGTHLRNIMLAMNPTTDKAAAAWERLGVQAYDADGSLRPLEDTFMDLKEAMKDMTDQERTETLSAMFNKTDLAAINALLDTEADRYKELTAAIDDSKGAAQEMADTQLDNLAGDITLFKSALEGAQIAVSDELTPSLRKFVQFGSEGLSELTQAFKEDGLDGAMEAFGNILSRGINMIIEMLPKAIDAGVKLLNAFIQGLVDNLPAIMDAALKIITSLAEALTTNLPLIIDAAVQILAFLGQAFIDNLPLIISAAMDILNMLSNALTNNTDALIAAAFSIITIIAQAILDNLPAIGNAAIEIIYKLAIGLAQALPDLVPTIVDICLKIVDVIIDNLDLFINASLQIIVALAEGIIRALPKLVDKVPVIISRLIMAIVANLPQLIACGVQLIIALVNGIMQAIPRIVAAIPALIAALVGGIKNGIEQMTSVGHNLIDGLWAGVKASWSRLIDNAKNLANDLIGTFKNILQINSPSKKFKYLGEMCVEGLEEPLEEMDLADVTDNVKSSLSSMQAGIAGANYEASGSFMGSMNNNVQVVLEGDAAGVFRLVKQENRKTVKSLGYSPLMA